MIKYYVRGDIMYKIGDFVVYRQVNVCKIEGVCYPTFEANAKRKYYKLSSVFTNNGTTVFVPIDSKDGLRAVSDKNFLEQALLELSSVKPAVFVAKKPPQLTAYYQEILSSNDLRKYLYLIKEVTIKERSNPKKLSEIDNRFKHKAEQLVCEEFAVVFNVPPEQIKERLYASMGL